MILVYFFLALLLAGPEFSLASYLDKTIDSEGVRIHFTIDPVTSNSPPPALQVDQFVRMKMKVNRLADGHPLNNWNVGAWLDMAISAASGSIPVCGQRVAGYLGGDLLQQPLLDLTGYYVLTLDAEPSVSVLDPSVNFAGRSSLYSAMHFEGRGFDWVKTTDDAKLFVGLADKPMVGIADLQTLQVLTHLSIPGLPTRLMLAPDERLLWVGHVGKDEGQEGVSVIDTVTNRLVASIALPAGHHEFAFSEDGQYVYASSRTAGVVTVVNAVSFDVVREVSIPGEPLSLVASKNNLLLWVIDGKNGRVHRFQANGQPVDSLALEPGVGPARLTPDGQFILVLNPSQHRLHVLSVETGKSVHAITVSGSPYDLMFSEQFLYVRGLESEQVALIALASLEKPNPTPQYFPAGSGVLALAKEGLPIASTMATALSRTGAFLASPTEKTVYHYMEGMNAPDSGLRTYGHTPMAAMVVQRGLRQVGPGEYSAVIKLPSAGRMVLALASDSPIIRECIGLVVNRPADRKHSNRVAFEWVGERVHRAVVGEPYHFTVRVRENPLFSSQLENSFELRLVPVRGGRSLYWPLVEDAQVPGQLSGQGIVSEPGGYYVHIQGAQPVDAMFTTLFVEEPDLALIGEEAP